MPADKKFHLLAFLLIISLLAYQISPFSLPTAEARFKQFMSFMNESSTLWNLPPCTTDAFGIGMSSQGNRVSLLTNGEAAYNIILGEFESATRTINIEIYSWRDDQVGKQFLDLLIRKAAEGVKIRVLVDAWGTLTTPPGFFKQLRSSGAEVAIFNPLPRAFLQGRLDNRQHRKIIIVDGKAAFLGGENIGDEYLGKNDKLGFWRDSGLLVEGPAVLSLQQVFFNDWLQATGAHVHSQYCYLPAKNEAGQQELRIVLGSPDFPRASAIDNSYCSLIKSAKTEVKICTPYFIPSRPVLDALFDACSRGVQVSILVPQKSDNLIAAHASQYYLDKLISRGISVFQYTPGFMHSKILIVDDTMASLGSANFDYLSFNKNYELNALINDRHIVETLRLDYQQDQKNSIQTSDATDRWSLQSIINLTAVVFVHML